MKKIYATPWVQPPSPGLNNQPLLFSFSGLYHQIPKYITTHMFVELYFLLKPDSNSTPTEIQFEVRPTFTLNKVNQQLQLQLGVGLG